MLRTRVLTAVALAAALVLALFALPAGGWCAIATVILALAAWEWSGLARQARGFRAAYAAGMAEIGRAHV